VASVTAVIARALGQATIVGYLLAGLIVGPYIPIPLFADAHRVEALAELGVVLVMFAIGLEFQLHRLFRVLPTAGLSGLVQVCFLLWAGYTVGSALGWSPSGALFLGSGIAISSTMVVTRVFAQSPVRKDVEEHVLAVLVIQDVLAIALIAAMTAVAQGGELSLLEVGRVLGKLLAVLVGLVAVGLAVIPWAVRKVTAQNSNEILVVFAIGLCFAVGVLAEAVGYSVALGAFVAGVCVAESGKAHDIEHLVAPFRDTFAGVFFVSIGMTVDPRLALEVLPISLGVLVVVVLGQLTSITFTGVLSGLGLRRSLGAGLALGQIGEFSFILSTIGIAAGAAPPELRPILVTVAVLSAVTTPLALKLSDTLVHRADAALPRRLQHALAMYEEWISDLRTKPSSPRPARGLGRTLTWLIVDGAALVTLLAVGLGLLAPASQHLSARFGWTTRQTAALVVAAIGLLSLPLILAFVNNTLKLSRSLGEQIAASVTGSPAQVAAALMRLAVTVGAFVGLGVPLLAVSQPWLGPVWSLTLLSLGLVFALVLFWRRAGSMDEELRSGVAELAARITTNKGTGERAAPEEGPKRLATLPGLEATHQVIIPQGSVVAGKTLASIDLRARTGAMVIGIRRKSLAVALPSGQDRLEVGDEVWLTGGDIAKQEAERILTDLGTGQFHARFVDPTAP
jgi:CPA2 family monovalent cation:H+ antiporter-2